MVERRRGPGDIAGHVELRAWSMRRGLRGFRCSRARQMEGLWARIGYGDSQKAWVLTATRRGAMLVSAADAVAAEAQWDEQVRCGAEPPGLWVLTDPSLVGIFCPHGAPVRGKVVLVMEDVRQRSWLSNAPVVLDGPLESGRETGCPPTPRDSSYVAWAQDWVTWTELEVVVLEGLLVDPPETFEGNKRMGRWLLFFEFSGR